MILCDFKKYLFEDGKSENTLASYILNVKKYFEYLQIDESEFMKLNREQIMDYKSYISTVKVVKPKTLNAKLSALSELNRFLIEKEIMKELVIKKKDFVKIQEAYASPNGITEETVEKFRNRILNQENKRTITEKNAKRKKQINEKIESEINKPVIAYHELKCKRDYCIVTFLAYGGLRISECLDLRLADFVFTKKNGNKFISEEIVVRSGKGNKARQFDMHYKIKNALEEYLKLRDSNSPYLFYSREDEKIDRTTINHLFNEYGEGLTPHKLRHFMISGMLNKGGFTVTEAMNVSGHQDPKTLMIYSHPSKQEMKAKMNKL